MVTSTLHPQDEAEAIAAAEAMLRAARERSLFAYDTAYVAWDATARYAMRADAADLRLPNHGRSKDSYDYTLDPDLNPYAGMSHGLAARVCYA